MAGLPAGDKQTDRGDANAMEAAGVEQQITTSRRTGREIDRQTDVEDIAAREGKLNNYNE